MDISKARVTILKRGGPGGAMRAPEKLVLLLLVLVCRVSRLTRRPTDAADGAADA